MSYSATTPTEMLPLFVINRRCYLSHGFPSRFLALHEERNTEGIGLKNSSTGLRFLPGEEWCKDSEVIRDRQQTNGTKSLVESANVFLRLFNSCDFWLAFAQNGS